MKLTTQRFKSIRELLGKTQPELAIILEVNPSSIYKWENGIHYPFKPIPEKYIELEKREMGRRKKLRKGDNKE